MGPARSDHAIEDTGDLHHQQRERALARAQRIDAVRRGRRHIGRDVQHQRSVDSERYRHDRIASGLDRRQRRQRPAVRFGRLQQTDIFTNIAAAAAAPSKLARDSFGAVAIAPINATAIFAAGADSRDARVRSRLVRASGRAVSRRNCFPSGGNVNRIGRLAVASNRLYVAGGDLGLLTYDTTSFAAPFALRSYATGATTSVVSLGTNVYVSRAATGITEFSQTSAGALTQLRSWDSGNDIGLGWRQQISSDVVRRDRLALGIELDNADARLLSHACARRSSRPF